MRILVVEDDAIITGHIGPLIVQAGHALVGIAADHPSAERFLRSSSVDLALIDLHLADGMTGLQVAATARETGAPFVLTTGHFRLMLDDFHGAVGMIATPYGDAELIAVIDYLAVALGSGRAGSPPAGLVLSTEWIERLHLGDAPRALPEADRAEEPGTRV